MSDTILVHDHGAWAEITLNRPDKLNSFNDEMHFALRSAIELARDQGKRAILLTGSGRGFCAGQDLGDRDPSKMDGPPDLGNTVRTFYAPLVRLIRSLEFPVICAVNGVAAGAGANLALACDMVLAGDNAKFIQSFSKVGLIPDTGGSWHLPRLLGEARAKGLAFTAQPLSAQQAEEWGLIWKCIPADELLNEARSLADQLANGPTLGLGMTKQCIQAAATETLSDHLELEADAMKTCGESDDYAEGVSAFLEKTQTEFSGEVIVTPEERAKLSADAMWADDHASKWFGMQIDEISEGCAVLSLTVEQQHCNGHAICHGGVTFSLADSAFAFACNSRNQVTVAQQNTINFIAPGHLGDRLTATAEERSLTGRSGIYDVTVTNQDGRVIAEFRGLSRAIKGQLFEEQDAPGEDK